MEPSKIDSQERSCNTCEHHVQERTLSAAPDICWNCVNTTSLIHWEPISIVKKPLAPLEYAALHQAVEAPKSALDTQVAGNHYKTLKIQPMEYSMGNKLDACQHTAIKYITRFRSKGGKQDLEKAKHAIDMLIEFEYGNS